MTWDGAAFNGSAALYREMQLRERAREARVQIMLTALIKEGELHITDETMNVIDDMQASLELLVNKASALGAVQWWHDIRQLATIITFKPYAHVQEMARVVRDERERMRREREA